MLRQYVYYVKDTKYDCKEREILVFTYVAYKYYQTKKNYKNLIQQVVSFIVDFLIKFKRYVNY